MNKIATYSKWFGALLLTLGASSSLCAQDVIVTEQGKKIAVKVQAVNIEEVHYVPADDPKGPSQIIKTAFIKRIDYADGHRDVFREENPPTMLSSETDDI
ncbi:MAG: hypothetical protein WBA12_10650 [Catalinimonas sp.]